MAKTPKRPRDLNQWAKHIVDIATGEADDTLPQKDAARRRSARRAAPLGKGGHAVPDEKVFDR
jgi:hypothetical protein